MLNAAWLILHLMTTAAPVVESAAARPAGMSCTYQACMSKCGGSNRETCHSYCEAKIPQRVAMGVCSSQGPRGG